MHAQSYLSMFSWSQTSTPASCSPSPSAVRGGYHENVVTLPGALEQTIKLRKGRGHLGSL